MMKYIFCILLGVFLCWGFHLISNEAQEAYRLEAGSNGIQTYSYSFIPLKLALYNWIKNRN